MAVESLATLGAAVACAAVAGWAIHQLFRKFQAKKDEAKIRRRLSR